MRAADGSVGPGQNATLEANCDAGEKATGGGGELGGNFDVGDAIARSVPIGSGSSTAPTGWRVEVVNGGAATKAFTVWAICAK